MTRGFDADLIRLMDALAGRMATGKYHWDVVRSELTMRVYVTALERSGGNKQKAARLVGVNRCALHGWITRARRGLKAG